jgi:hypothetical protein
MRLFWASAAVAVMASIGQAGPILYGAGTDSSLYTIDPTTGTTTLIGAMGTAMYDIAYHSGMGLFGVTGGTGTSALFQIDTTTAAPLFVNNVKTTGNANLFLNALVISSTGTMFGTGGSTLYTIDPTTAIATAIGSGLYISSGDLEFDNAGNLYLTASGMSGDALYRLDTTTGAGTLVGYTGYTGVYGLAFLNGAMYGLTSNGEVIAIDLSTGAGTLVSGYSPTIFGAATDVTGGGGTVPPGVPEPATLVLVGSALGGLGLLRAPRRKR